VENLSDYKEISDMIKASGGDAFKRCFQCGLCDIVCPWNKVRPFSMRKIVREAAFGFTDIESEDLWLCTTCGKCPTHCPRDVQQIESGIALRKIALEYDILPDSAAPIRGISGSLTGEGNPFNEERKKRADWAKELSVKKFDGETELLYFTGCYFSYDPRLKKAAVSTVKILKKAGVNFGILGDKESCCGESIRKTGNEQLFKKLAYQNINTFVDNGVKKILVSSPHCYHTFKNEYPEIMKGLEVIHITEYLSELFNSKKLKITKDYNKKVAYHDPCYLGRHNGIYNEPREILKQIPKLELIEMEDTMEDSLCCGGGGGRIWMETKKEERFSDIRLQQAIDASVEVLVTACPYCVANFEDSKLTVKGSEHIEIKEISEIIAEAL
jgi:Fe-S oxidoreductase